MTHSNFEALINTPFDDVISNIHAVADGEPHDIFQVPEELTNLDFKPKLTDIVPPKKMAVQRIITDKIMSFYLISAFTTMSNQDFDARLRIIGLEHFETAYHAGLGVQLINSHFGPARLVPTILARLGWDLAHVSPINDQVFADTPLKGTIDQIQLGKEFDLRVLGQCRDRLLKGGIVHSTGDGMHGTSMSIHKFLGKTRPFTKSFGFLSLSTGAASLPVFLRSDENGRLTLEFRAYLDHGDGTAALDTRIENMISSYAKLLEQRWLTDFCNVPPHSLQLYQRNYTRSP